MRVLHVIPSLDPATGGPPVVTCALAAAQGGLGWEPEVLSYRIPGAEDRIKGSLKGVPGIDRVKWQYLAPLTKFERFFARKGDQWLEQSVRQYDLLHLHGVWDPLVRAAGLQAIGKKVPFVLTPHGMLDTWALAQNPLRKRLALLVSYRHILNEARFLHYLTEAERERSAPLQLKPAAVILPNGIFVDQLEPLPDRGRYRAAHPELNGGKLVLFLGRLHFKKGLDVLLDAFTRVCGEMPEAHLIVAGPDYGARGALEAQVQRLNLREHVHLVGSVFGDEKLAALRDAECFVLTSRQEGFSIAIIEAMACGLPVVITPGCHFPQVQDAGAGVIAELEPGAIADALLAVLRDPAGSQERGQRGRELVEREFTWSTIAQAMVEQYRKAVGK
jgi:glycosyltransferase involved in cell wall biosynthesis